MDFFDYEPAASGMTYRNSLNTAGVAIDGSPDSLTAGVPDWELVTGSHGSLIMVGRMDTDAAITLTSFYDDDDTSPTTQCTGDADAYGSSGLWVTSGIPNTDPTLHAARLLPHRAGARSTTSRRAPASPTPRCARTSRTTRSKRRSSRLRRGPGAPAVGVALLAASILASSALRGPTAIREDRSVGLSSGT